LVDIIKVSRALLLVLYERVSARMKRSGRPRAFA
jgi:hypothetical protein